MIETDEDLIEDLFVGLFVSVIVVTDVYGRKVDPLVVNGVFDEFAQRYLVFCVADILRVLFVYKLFPDDAFVFEKRIDEAYVFKRFITELVVPDRVVVVEYLSYEVKYR